MESHKTWFAASERAFPEELRRQGERIRAQGLFAKALNVFPKIVLVLNPQRQVVHCNRTLCDFLGVRPEEIFGKRPGEIFNCIHAECEPGGCGTSLFCRECGAARSILIAQTGKESSEECRMTVHRDGKEKSLDLKVWSVPYEADGTSFVVFIIDDIANEKRREALEKTFFHDVLNETGVVLGYLDNMVDAVMPTNEDSLKRLRGIARRIVHAIESQRALLEAEKGSLKLFVSDIEIAEFLKGLAENYGTIKEARGKKIELEYPAEKRVIRTDRVLLERVMGNLVKNALEASPAGTGIRVSYSPRSGDGNLFSVHNGQVMPETVQRQIFQRSFSTKGNGRGIGTYSVRFFTENCLGGKVSFESKEGKGTVFQIQLQNSR